MQLVRQAAALEVRGFEYSPAQLVALGHVQGEAEHLGRGADIDRGH